MSWGSARDRDDRRKSAMARLPAQLEKAKDLSKKADAVAKSVKNAGSKSDQESAAAAQLRCRGRVVALELTIENTQKNMGMGTSALAKRTPQKIKTKEGSVQ